MTRWYPTNDLEVSELISNLDTSKSSNIESIDCSFFKDCMYDSIDKVVYLFNPVWRTRIFPNAWQKIK